MHSGHEGRIIGPNKFAEGWGFNSLPITMVVAPIASIALALTKGWFFNRNRNGDTRNNDDNTEENVMKKAIRSSNTGNGNKGKAFKNTIGAVLDVIYNTTVGMGAGALLQQHQVSER